MKQTRGLRALGCMFGAAAGDSLGARVEFMSMRQILEAFPPAGIQEPQPFDGHRALSVTDDTQQAIFVGRGLIRAAGSGYSDEGIRAAVWCALKQWRVTQEQPTMRRAPGVTSLKALESHEPGSAANPLNESDSCGAVMRGHPIGMLFAADPERAYDVGTLIAMLTHGGSEAGAATGAYAALIALLHQGMSLDPAIDHVIVLLRQRALKSQTLTLLLRARGQRTNGRIDTALAALGEGWQSDEALAMGIFAARCYPQNLRASLTLAVNHSGDSDTTGSIAGAITGAIGGISALPHEWRRRIEYSRALADIANTLAGITPQRRS